MESTRCLFHMTPHPGAQTSALRVWGLLGTISGSGLGGASPRRARPGPHLRPWAPGRRTWSFQIPGKHAFLPTLGHKLPFAGVGHGSWPGRSSRQRRAGGAPRPGLLKGDGSGRPRLGQSRTSRLVSSPPPAATFGGLGLEDTACHPVAPLGVCSPGLALLTGAATSWRPGARGRRGRWDAGQEAALEPVGQRRPLRQLGGKSS
ncbi:uncharacterized protein LOC110741588 [Papio anubis]|uniref:uncharacterized protein LOC110741588 n=1 Tax=Papio anubis TaxID=9555 RepID=UPI0012AE786D|nr:uncharacterized protein LOC110741588 [Papio anubis]